MGGSSEFVAECVSEWVRWWPGGWLRLWPLYSSGVGLPFAVTTEGGEEGLDFAKDEGGGRRR